MIDPQARDRASRDQLEQQPMRRIKDLRQFHPDRGQIVDVEETAVVDFLRRHPPESEAIRLIVQQRIERVEATGIARRAIDLGESLLDRLLHQRRFLAAPLQPALDDFLLPGALRDALRIGLGAPREIFQRGDDALQLRIEIFLLEAAPASRARSRGCAGKCPARSEIRARSSEGKTRPLSKCTCNSPRSRTRPY